MNKIIINKTVKLTILFILTNSILLLFQSCQSNKSKSEKYKDLDDQLLYENFIEVEQTGVNYKIPSPMEMFIFLKKADAPFLNNKTHKTQKCINYISKKEKAINFGIYSADLAYCSVFGDFQQTLIYFKTIKQLADNLGLHEGFGKQMATRIDKNLTNIDSLMEISADSYYKANRFMEEQGQTDIMGLMLVGGWIEGLYLAIESVNDINNSPITERIADQQVLLENLLGYLQKNQNSDDITKVIQDLEQLQEVFDELYFNDENTIITKNQFVNITNGVKSLRNIYIN